MFGGSNCVHYKILPSNRLWFALNVRMNEFFWWCNLMYFVWIVANLVVWLLLFVWMDIVLSQVCWRERERRYSAIERLKNKCGFCYNILNEQFKETFHKFKWYKYAMCSHCQRFDVNHHQHYVHFHIQTHFQRIFSLIKILFAAAISVGVSWVCT